MCYNTDMRRFVIFCLIFGCLIFSVTAESIYSIGTNYIFFNEYSTYKNVKTDSHLNGLGLDFSYRFFGEDESYTTDFDINADDGSFIVTPRRNINIGFWYSLNVNFPLVANMNLGVNSLNLSYENANFWALLMDNICGVTFIMNLRPNFFIDASIGPKVGFFYINYESMTNLTLGLGMELGGRYYFNNVKNPEKQMGFGFGSKISYDFYSISQVYFPNDYSNYGIFSITPFISFMLKN